MLAMACGLSAVVSVSASADGFGDPESDGIASITSYDPCDVNHDGNVTIIDVITINHFLNGIEHVVYYNRLDADRNMIIDAADSMCVLNYLIENDEYSANFISRTYSGSSNVGGTITETAVPFQYHSGGGVDSQSSSSDPVEYSRYSYTSHSTLSSYTLSPVTMSPYPTFQGDEPRAIIDGTDDRYSTTLPENKGIVCLESWDDNKTIKRTTGFIVGDHRIATCAHGVYGGYTGEQAHFLKNLRIITYNSDGSLSTTTLTPLVVHIPELYKQSYSRENDYALITVQQTLSTTNHPHFAIGNYYNLSTSNYSHIPICVTGCPSDVNGQSNTSARLYSQMGHLSNTNAYDTTVIRYNTDATGGNSGSPVYTIIKDSDNLYYYTALSIHQGANSNINPQWYEGVRFNKYHKQFYLNNPYANS